MKNNNEIFRNPKAIRTERTFVQDKFLDLKAKKDVEDLLEQLDNEVYLVQSPTTQTKIFIGKKNVKKYIIENNLINVSIRVGFN